VLHTFHEPVMAAHGVLSARRRKRLEAAAA
jgi:hypothetical protein